MTKKAIIRELQALQSNIIRENLILKRKIEKIEKQMEKNLKNDNLEFLDECDHCHNKFQVNLLKKAFSYEKVFDCNKLLCPICYLDENLEKIKKELKEI